VATARAAVEAGADAVGLVFIDKSPRYVNVEQARAVIRSLPPFVEPVALFVDSTVSDIQRTAAAIGIQTVQLHGGESEQIVQALQPLRIIKAVAFDGTNTLQNLTAWQDTHIPLAGILLDAPTDDQTLTGGSGQTIDWQAVAKLATLRSYWPVPFILAGGLTPANVAQAISITRPYAVDVSSGVESTRGVKDVDKIRVFCQAVRRADEQL